MDGLNRGHSMSHSLSHQQEHWQNPRTIPCFNGSLDQPPFFSAYFFPAHLGVVRVFLWLRDPTNRSPPSDFEFRARRPGAAPMMGLGRSMPRPETLSARPHAAGRRPPPTFHLGIITWGSFKYGGSKVSGESTLEKCMGNHHFWRGRPSQHSG